MVYTVYCKESITRDEIKYNSYFRQVAEPLKDLVEWFDKTVDVSFEGYSFKAPAGYDGILTAMYGDYMKLPPVEKQKIHHENNTFWLEN